MKLNQFDPAAVYTCRNQACKGPLPAGTITPLNFEWHRAHGTDCSAACHARRLELLANIKAAAKKRVADARKAAAGQPPPGRHGLLRPTWAGR